MTRCTCGHDQRWHGHGGEGACEHDGDCACPAFAADPVTVAELRRLQRAHERAAAKAKAAQEARNAAVREALAEGESHAWIAEATGLSRGRIGQMAQEQTKGKR